MKIKTKLLVGYLFMAVLALVLSVTNIYGLSNTQTQYNSIINTADPTIVALREIQFFFIGQSNDERGFLIMPADSFKGEIEAKSAEVKKRIQSIQGNMVNNQERQLLQKIANTHDQFTKINLNVIATYNTGNHDKAVQISFNEGRQMRKDLMTSDLYGETI